MTSAYATIRVTRDRRQRGLVTITLDRPDRLNAIDAQMHDELQRACHELKHDPDARAVLITPSRTLADRVARAVAVRMPEDGPARASIKSHGGIIVTASLQEAMDLANQGAAEHLVVDDDRLAARVRSAGSLFVGPWSAQVAGDYAIGSNHVLPTAGAARVRGGLSAADFVRQITVQRVTRDGLARIGRSVIDLARAEGLNAHAESIVVRLGKGSKRS